MINRQIDCLIKVSWCKESSRVLPKVCVCLSVKSVCLCGAETKVKFAVHQILR